MGNQKFIPSRFNHKIKSIKRLNQTQVAHLLPTVTNAGVSLRMPKISKLVNLTTIFIDLCDYWIVIDNSINPYKFIAEGGRNLPATIYQKEIWKEIKTTHHEK